MVERWCCRVEDVDVVVLCTYADVLGTPPAVVSVKYGHGRAILSGRDRFLLDFSKIIRRFASFNFTQI